MMRWCIWNSKSIINEYTENETHHQLNKIYKHEISTEKLKQLQWKYTVHFLIYCEMKANSVIIEMAFFTCDHMESI